MATPSEVGSEIAAAMTRCAGAVSEGSRRALSKIGDAAQDEMEAAAGRAVPGGRLRNHGGARFSVTVTENADTVDVIPVGPWGILEPGARPHPITAGRPMPAGPSRFRWGPFRHPGTSDTGAWTAGFEETTSAAERMFPEVVGDAVEDAFG